ncbi:hypothetical protein [Ilumatobacter sp.]
MTDASPPTVPDLRSDAGAAAASCTSVQVVRIDVAASRPAADDSD